MHKQEQPAQRASLAISSLVSSITTTKGQGFYIELFGYVPFPWNRNPKCKQMSSLFSINPFNCVMQFDLKLSSCKKGPWKFHGCEVSFSN